MDKKKQATSKLSNTDRLKRYRGRIEQAKGFRRHEGYDDLWRRMNDMYRGKQVPKGMESADAFVVNVAFSTINIIGPSIAINYPKTRVAPTDPEFEDVATITEAVVNHWWRKYEFLSPFQSAVKDSLIFGFGWLKEGWLFVEQAEENLEGKKKQFEELSSQADQFAAENPDLAAALPSDDDILDMMDEDGRWQWKTVEDRPFLQRVSVHDVFVDPEATCLQDMRWIAHKVVKTVDELESEPGFRKESLKWIKPDSGLTDDWFSPKMWESDQKDDEARYTCWEYYDVTTNEMCVFTEQGDKFLVDPTKMPYKYGHPFVMIRNYEVPDHFYPMGELEALEPLQDELNMTRTAMFNDRKSFRRKHLYNPQAFDRQGVEALESDHDNVMVPVNPGFPLGEAIVPMPGQQPNPMLYGDSQQIESDITQVTGINEYQRGALPEIRRTATEAAIIQDVANARAADKLARVEGAVSEISRRMVVLAQQFLHEGQAASIVGGKGKQVHFFFEPDDIQGDFMFTVEGGSTRPKNDVARKQTALDLLQALAPFGDPQLGLVNMQEVIGYALEYGFEVDNPARFLGKGGPPRMGGPDEAFAEDGMGGPQEGGMMPPPGLEEGLPPELAAMLAPDPVASGMPTTTPEPLAGATEAQLAAQIGLSLG